MTSKYDSGKTDEERLQIFKKFATLVDEFQRGSTLTSFETAHLLSNLSFEIFLAIGTSPEELAKVIGDIANSKFQRMAERMTKQ